MVLGYRLPQYHPGGKNSYVDFYAFDPSRGEMRRKKIHVDKYKSKREKKLHADMIIEAVTLKLRSGWNPWCDAERDRSFTPISEILDRYREHVDKTCRPRTKENYMSRCKVLEEYNAGRYKPIKYAYEYDSAFIIEFLDHILIDRESGPRTRNNYKGWCSALGEFMKQRRYIDENPAEGISKIKEREKIRQPLSRKQLRDMRQYLQEENPHFLLACLMEYYTFIRPTELSFLRIDWIEVKQQRILIPAEVSKNKRSAYVGLNRTLIRMMIDLKVFDNPGDHYLFGRGFKPSTTRVDADQFNKRWVQMRKKLGWGSEYQFYSLKDSGIRDLANAEGIVIARDQARHTDIATTNKYLGIDKNVHAETKDFEGAFGSESVELAPDES